jgi:septation ring formation regulator EzrA
METDLIVVSETVGREIAQIRVDLGRLRRHVDLRMDRLEQTSERTRTAVQACQRERSSLTGCAVGQALAITVRDHGNRYRRDSSGWGWS